MTIFSPDNTLSANCKKLAARDSVTGRYIPKEAFGLVYELGDLPAEFVHVLEKFVMTPLTPGT